MTNYGCTLILGALIAIVLAITVANVTASALDNVANAMATSPTKGH
jgi:hypothetical protein